MSYIHLMQFFSQAFAQILVLLFQITQDIVEFVTVLLKLRCLFVQLDQVLLRFIKLAGPGGRSTFHSLRFVVQMPFFSHQLKKGLNCTGNSILPRKKTTFHET